MSDKPKVFISSTVRNLEVERETVRRFLLKSFNYDVFASEFEGSKWESASEICLEQLRNADLVILILADKYGYIPSKRDFPFDGKTSVAHGEFLMAEAHQKPVLVYVKKVTAPEPRQGGFIQKVKQFHDGCFVSHFTNCRELLNRTKEDVPNLIARLIRGQYRSPEGHLPVVIHCKTARDVHRVGAKALSWIFANVNAPSLLLTGGGTNSGIFDEFFRHYEKGSIRNASIFTNFEYLGVSPQNELSRKHYFHNLFVSRVERIEGGAFADNGNIVHYIPGTINHGTLETACLEYDSLLVAHKPFVALLGIGPNGQFSAICPEKTSGNLREQLTSVAEIGQQTAAHLSPAPKVPFVVTVGAKNILSNVRNVLVPMVGSSKTTILKKILHGPTDESFPPHVLREHKNLIFVVDNDAAAFSLRKYRAEKLVDAGNVDFRSLFDGG
jgi:6-phosphogluconolactonase/glucosamine-6-phosphate isomerase/deaminase